MLMLTPMALALLGRAADPRLAAPVMLGIAYGASIGGMGTLIGTPLNVIFAGIYAEETGQQFGFLRWMAIGIPIAVIAIPVAALWLARHLRGSSPLRTERPGPWRPAERHVLVVFGLAVAAWITQTGPYGGWTALLGLDPASDATVALAAALAMFLVPDGQGGRLLDWPSAESMQTPPRPALPPCRDDQAGDRRQYETARGTSSGRTPSLQGSHRGPRCRGLC